jgi:CubicO group peptidase (beta-lactamase class C family)
MGDVSDVLAGGLPSTINEFVHYLNDVPLNFAPGTGQAYSNIGYIVLSEIVETVKRVAYFNYHVTAVLSPLILADAVKIWSSNRAEYTRELVAQESRVGLSAEDLALDEQDAFVFGGDGMHKEATVGPSASIIVRFMAR